MCCSLKEPSVQWGHEPKKMLSTEVAWLTGGKNTCVTAFSELFFCFHRHVDQEIVKIIRERLGACKVREGVNAAENCAKDLQLFKDVAKAYRDRCKSTPVTFFTLNLCKTRSHILGQWFSKRFGVRILFTYVKVIEGVNEL